MKQSNDEEKDLNWALKLIVLVAAILAAVAVSFYFTNFSGELSESQADWGVFGDYVGGVLNPVFGFLVLIALLMTISLQATELKLTRKELKNSSDALNAQNETLVLQNFENSFFQMLRLHNDIVNSIDFVRGGGNKNVVTTSGRDCFPVMCERLKTRYSKIHDLIDQREIVESAYEGFYEQHQVELAHYFRYLYNIFKFIHKSQVADKRFYSNLLRAQISNHELVIIFYNCISKYGKERFLPLAVEYSLFNNMPTALLLNEDHRSWLPESAYAQND
ncbi:putative phage abortive infection protein [Methylophaga sp.]|uniref:putative phage abortive infection protein n=1 Tax=Methylophaga sp. TaxID=2024840 RepID=UPI0025CC7A0B|nr:putative phage abortive infection protein [Methylophaga sp.]